MSSSSTTASPSTHPQESSTTTRSSSSSIPPLIPQAFTLNGDKYNQNTYYGRFQKMLDLVDPRTLFYTQQDLYNAQKVLLDYKNQQQNDTIDKNDTNTNVNDNELLLWKCKKIRDTMIHPDTGEIIPRPFRMSGFLPFNSPICLGALMATTPATILCSQWLNQTHNALINYYNGNKTQPTDYVTLGQGYVGAVTGACGVSLGLKTIIDRSSSIPDIKKIKLQRFVALPAIITAAAINVILMRRNELTTGINVYTEQKNDNDTGMTIVIAGSSQIAAKKALTEMVISRMILPLPVFLLPPIGLSIIDNLSIHSTTLTRLMQKNKHTTLVLNTIFILLGFSFGLPATIALFPQIGTIQTNELESKFHHLKDSHTGKVIQSFKYNKGL
jgi:tricarboxylate carrier